MSRVFARQTWTVSLVALALAAAVLFQAAPAGAAPVAPLTFGNPPIDAFENEINFAPGLVVADGNNPVSADSRVTKFSYYAKSVAPFYILIVDDEDGVAYVSPQIVPPSANAAHDFTPATPITVEAGSRIGYWSAPADPAAIAVSIGGVPPRRIQSAPLPTEGDTLEFDDEVLLGVKSSLQGTLTCFQTCYVDAANGDDTNDGLTANSALATIQEGVGRLMDEGTVFVAAGTYNESVVISKALFLDGPNKDVPAWDTSLRGPEAVVVGTAAAIQINGATEVWVNGF